MKKTSILLLAFACVFEISVIAQSTTNNNSSFAFPQMLGYDGTVLGGGAPKVLEIRNDFNLPIEFHTNGTQRMYIANGGATNGFVGIGSNFSTPASLLHVNGTNNNTGNLFETTGPLGLDNIWEMNVTNALATRFIIRIPANQFHTQFETNNNGQFNFFTNTSASGNARSVSIQGGVGNVVHGQVAFGNALPINFDAQSRLHLHKTIELFTLLKYLI